MWTNHFDAIYPRNAILRRYDMTHMTNVKKSEGSRKGSTRDHVTLISENPHYFWTSPIYHRCFLSQWSKAGRLETKKQVRS